jgi:hypothetical protein
LVQSPLKDLETTVHGVQAAITIFWLPTGMNRRWRDHTARYNNSKGLFTVNPLFSPSAGIQ